MNTASTPAPRISSPEAKVKPMEWPGECKRGRRVASRGVLDISYSIAYYGADVGDPIYRWAAPRSAWSEPLQTYEEAKAGAQAHYEQAILSALRAPSSPAGEPEWTALARDILENDAPDKFVWKSHETQDEWIRAKLLPCIRAALASPVPPPLPGEAVAWRYQFRPGDAWSLSDKRPSEKSIPPATGRVEPLYATPPARALPGITEEDVERAKAAFSAVYGAGLSRTDAGWKDNTDKAIRAALEAISRPAEREKWKPIETAPKGELIDIWIGENGGGCRWTTCYYDVICDEWRTSRPSGHLVCIKARFVTHWMPIPAAPSTDHVGGGE